MFKKFTNHSFTNYVWLKRLTGYHDLSVNTGEQFARSFLTAAEVIFTFLPRMHVSTGSNAH